jgi:hypothetical protein
MAFQEFRGIINVFINVLRQEWMEWGFGGGDKLHFA